MDVPKELIRILRGIAHYKKRWCLYTDIVMTWEDQRAIIGITNGGKETPLSTVRLCRIKVPLNKALDTSESPDITMG